jgi:hypothetical protein
MNALKIRPEEVTALAMLAQRADGGSSDHRYRRLADDLGEDAKKVAEALLQDDSQVIVASAEVRKVVAMLRHWVGTLPNARVTR